MTTRIVTAAGAGPDTRFFVPFTKVEENADGSVYVEGIATGEILDFHGEVVSYEASKRAFAEWSAWAEKATGGESIGNIRVMHQPIVAGRAVKWWADDATRSIHLGATIDDPAHAKLCRSRAYTGYSIGGGNVTREMQPWEGKSVPWITDYDLSENSLVDKPACPTSIFTLVKRAITKEPPMNLFELLKANPSATFAIRAKMTDAVTIKNGDAVLSIAGTPKLPVAEFRKDAASAVIAGGDALAALKSFLMEVLGVAGDPPLWTIGDICESMRYCYSARMGAQYDLADAIDDGVVAAAAPATELKKSDTPADPLVEEKPVDEKVDPAKAPEPAPAVPPAVPEPEKQAAVDLGPVLDAIAKLAALLEPMVKALQEGSLQKASGAQDLTQLVADVSTIKKAIESFPAPPAGRPVMKSIGAIGGTSGEITPDTLEKAVEVLEASGRLDHADRVKLRVALATATIERGQQQR